MTETLVSGGMSAIFEHNLLLVRRRFPGLVHVLERYHGTVPGGVEIAAARNGAPTAAVRRPGGLLYVHSAYNPLAEAERWAREAGAHEPDFVVVIGMGLGYHLEELVKARPGRTLVVVEPEPEILAASMAARDQRGWLAHPRLDVLVTTDGKAAAGEVFQRHAKQLLQHPHLVVWPAAARYAPGFCADFNRQLLDLVRARRVDLATNRKLSTNWIENFFLNMWTALGDPDVGALFQAFSGRPAIIVASGPSLDRNVHLLPLAKGRAVMIAAGSAVNPLLRHGLEPDLVVSFDPGKANYRHFKNLKTPGLPLVYVPTIYSHIVAEYSGPRFSAGMDVFPFVSWFYEQVGETRAELSSGPSVANVAWDLAVKMGLNPIILVGQDLAYSGDRTHADGTVRSRAVEIRPEEIGTKYLEVEAVDGGKVWTSRSMHAMKVWFEEHLRVAPAGLTTIDATEGGAKIAGTKIMLLQEALEAYCQEAFTPHETVLAIHQRESSQLKSRHLQDALAKVLGGLVKQLRTADSLAQTGVVDAQKLLLESKTRRLTDQRYREAFSRLERVRKELFRLEAFQVFVQPLVAPALEAFAVFLEARTEEAAALHDKGQELARQYGFLFESVKQTATDVRRLIRNAEAPRSSGASSQPISGV